MGRRRRQTVGGVSGTNPANAVPGKRQWLQHILKRSHCSEGTAMSNCNKVSRQGVLMIDEPCDLVSVQGKRNLAKRRKQIGDGVQSMFKYGRSDAQGKFASDFECAQ